MLNQLVEQVSWRNEWALNISLILKEESYFDAVIDPLGGSYALEDLTEQIGGKSWDLFQKLESLGGISSEKLFTI